MTDQKLGRDVGLVITLGVALCMAYNLVMALHVVLLPNWPLWVCVVLGVVVTLLLMVFVVTGTGNIYYEGIVVWVLIGSTLAGLAYTVVDSHEKRLVSIERKHQSQLEWQREQRQIERDKQLLQASQVQKARRLNQR